MDEVLAQLVAQRDEGYQAFQQRLLPSLEPGSIIGVRTPALRRMAEEMRRDGRDRGFLASLPHRYFEEDQLHGFLISGMTDLDGCLAALERFLPYVNNWATCDQTSPKVFRRHRQALLPYISRWLQSEHCYTVRFAIGMLMQHFLDDDFRPEHLEAVAGVRSEEYYVKMEIAWYMATALAKQWDAAVGYIEGRKLDRWVHNRTIQKARESRRITDSQKEYLKGFVWKQRGGGAGAQSP